MGSVGPWTMFAAGYTAGALAARDSDRDGGLDVERLARLIVSYADLTHRVVVNGGDPREIADEWGKVVDECRAYLARRSPDARTEDGTEAGA